MVLCEKVECIETFITFALFFVVIKVRPYYLNTLVAVRTLYMYHVKFFPISMFYSNGSETHFTSLTSVK